MLAYLCIRGKEQDHYLFWLIAVRYRHRCLSVNYVNVFFFCFVVLIALNVSNIVSELGERRIARLKAI